MRIKVDERRNCSIRQDEKTGPLTIAHEDLMVSWLRDGIGLEFF